MNKSNLWRVIVTIIILLCQDYNHAFSQTENTRINDSINALVQEHLQKGTVAPLVVYDPQTMEFKIMSADSVVDPDNQLETAKYYLYKGIRENLSSLTDEAVRSFELAYTNAPDNKEYTGKILENLTYSYNHQGKFNEAITTGERALGYATESRKPVIKLLISDAYLMLNKMDSALVTAEQGLEFSRAMKDMTAEVYSLTQMGKVHYMLGNRRIAGNYFKEARELANKHGQTESNSIANYYLSLYYDFTGRATKSKDYMKKYLANRDSLILSPNPSIDWLLMAPQNAFWDYQKISSAQKRKRMITFILFCVIIISGLAFIVYRDRMKRRELVLESKISRLQINPHFILNSMNSLQRSILENETDRSNEFLSLFSRLIRFIFSSSFENYVSLKQEIKFLEDYTALERIRYKDNLNFNFSIEEDLDTKNTLIPTMLIQPFIENSIWHGVLPKGKPGLITITFQQVEADKLICTIEDDGIGRQQAKKLEDDSVNHGNTHSTILVKDRLDKFSKFEKKRFSFNYEDILDKADQIAGTKVILQIPLKWEL